MAIIKTIRIYDTSGITKAQKYIENSEKTTRKSTENQVKPGQDADRNISLELGYDTNPEKTTLHHSESDSVIGSGASNFFQKQEDILVDGYLCDPGNAAAAFRYARNRYHNLHSTECADPKKKPVIAVHLIQSFPEEEGLDPRLVHQIGIEFVQGLKEKSLGEYEAVISTHMNTKHLHNHILLNAYSHDGKRKFHDNKTTRKVLMQLNDELSLKYGLPILHENDIGLKKSHSIGEHYARLSGESWKEQIRTDMKACLSSSRTFSDWYQAMKDCGYEFRERNDGTPLSICDGNPKHRVRLEKLGTEYTYDGVILQLAQKNQINIRTLKDIREQQDPDPSTGPTFVPEYFKKVRRYSEFGRRRSDLEMIILTLIQYLKRILALIQHCMEMRQYAYAHDYLTNQSAIAEKQLRYLEKSLDLMKKYDIDRIADIASRKKITGKALQQFRKLATDFTHNAASISGYLKKTENVEPLPPDGKSPLLAALSPMTPTQRYNLFILSKDSGWRVHTSFDNISAGEAAEAIHFLKDSPSRRDPYTPLAPAIFRAGFIPTVASETSLGEELRTLFRNIGTCRQEAESLSAQYKELVFLERTCEDARDNFRQMDELQKEARKKANEKDRQRSSDGRSTYLRQKRSKDGIER